MKVVIVGGGIAGLTLGILLRNKNFEVVINERLSEAPHRGHAFLMHKEGLAILRELNPKNEKFSLGKLIETFSLRRPSGLELKHLHLDSWKCIKRSDLLNFLYQLFPEGDLKKGRSFSNFIFKDDKAIAAVFENGDIEYGDIFVGADGANSNVRKSMFCEFKLTDIYVKEVVGVVNNEELSKQMGTSFVKYQHDNKGLAFGYIPTSEKEFVWFMQYDSNLNDVENNSSASLKSFCTNQLKEFPPIVTQIMENNDFSKSYIWNTRDADLLPSFHKKNVVLIGDAAHLLLPFTSAGTTNAIVDAKAIAEELKYSADYETAFDNFYHTRSPDILKHILLGRELKEVFLSPKSFNVDHIPVPLISQKENKEDDENKDIDILYFTDPICSTCWIIQPILLKLKLEYGKYINIRYCMGGLLPSWEEYTKGIISNPEDAARHWEEVSFSHEMPIDGDVWLEDPLMSSYPPSIAFKAAQLQDNYLSLVFLRRIKEMVFVEKKNIIKWQILETAAYESGLDTARLHRDYYGIAKELFKQDLELAKELGIVTFPTFIFANKNGEKVSIKGLQAYGKFEAVIHQLFPEAKKEKINTSPENLFKEYPTLAPKEFAFLSDLTKEEANIILNDLFEAGHIEKYESKNGVLWKSRYTVRNW